MRARLAWLIVIFAAAGVGIWLLAGGKGAAPGTPAASGGTAPSPTAESSAAANSSVPEVVTVRAVTVAEEAIGPRVTVTGTVTPNREVTLVSKVSGTVRWVAGDMGTRVDSGQPVVELDDTELRLNLEQRRAQLSAAEANLARLLAGAAEEEIAQARASAEQARASFDRVAETLARIERLYAEGAVTKDALLGARTDYEVARLQHEAALQRLALLERGATEEDIQAARAQVEQAEAAVRLAEQQLADATIRAPFSGLLASRPAQVGAMVSAGTPVAVIVDIDRVLIEAGLSEREVNRVRVGQPVQVRVDALGGGSVTGTVTAVAPVAGNTAGVFPVRFAVENPDHRLKPGMVARVEVELEREAPAPVVPRSAVVYRGGRPVVFVVEESNGGEAVARERPVTVGAEADNVVAVTSGLRAGERVIVPQAGIFLQDGMRIRVIQEDV
ncbi:MAG: efflux RND transporter periplasmic adaptor subunit [Firmicutes bacterium]|nr:efflux RND transporter periplasmic adaptor subunit [Bacillota bacterium]